MMPFELHWLRPEWWLAPPLLALLLWWLKRSGDGGIWRRVCDPHLLRHLLQDTGRRYWLGLLGAGWLLAVLALAGPTWDQRPQPLYRNQAARVLVLDLSHSMLADDLRPSRLAQARFAINDLLTHDDSRHALVAYAGDAFAVAPLTHDSATLSHLLAALEPELMPAPGSRPARGLALAGELLRRAGVERGRIVLIGDAADAEAVAEADRLRTAGHRVSVLAVGTPDGAPLPGDEENELLKDAVGNIVIARLDRTGLQTVASRGGGGYLELRPDTWNPDRLLVDTPVTDNADDPTASAGYWEERGPWLVLALLPLAALAFRRGWLLLLVVGLWPPPAPALDWNDLWQNREQQAHQALLDDQPQRARSLSRDPWRSGTAAYRAGDFEQAARDFEQVPGAIGAYNRGNALARLGDYPQAITAYSEALNQDPELREARDNKRLIEQLLEEQQQTGGEGDEQQPESSDPRDGGFGQAGGSGSDQPFDNAPESSPESDDGKTPDETAPDPARETSTEPDENADRGDTPSETDPLERERQQALEQWLRRVPDDPGGLLRRKFQYQYQERERAPDPIDPW